MTYIIRKHVGLRESMAHVHNGVYGQFNDWSDAIAWAHFKHDDLNNTYICFEDGTILYAITPAGQASYREAYDKLTQDEPWIKWQAREYRIKKA